MKLSKKLLTLLSSLAIATSISSAHAGLIGTGPAVNHVDAAEATVTKLAGNLYSIAMPKRTSGQWMGVRSIKGKDKIKVGNLTAEQLSVGWNRLLYTSSPVKGTLIWKECCDKRKFAPIHVVGKPKRTSRGVIFNVTSIRTLPSNLKNMSIHLVHAPTNQRSQILTTRSLFSQKSDPITTFPSTQTQNIVDDLWTSSYNENANSLQLRIYNSSNNNTCWSYTWSNVIAIPGGAASESVPNNTCDNIQYTDYVSGIAGGSLQLEHDGNGLSTLSLYVTPPNEATYSFESSFDEWVYD